MPQREKPPKNPTGLFHARRSRNMTVTQLAEKTKQNKQTIGKLERGLGDPRGGMKFTKEWAEKFAKVLKYSPEEILFWDRFHPPGEHIESGAIAGLSEDGAANDGALVPIVGYVGAGDAAHFYAVAQDSLDDTSAPVGATEKTVAVEIRGTSLGKMFDRWLAFYNDVRRPVTPDLHNQLCVVGLADDRVLIKKIRPARNGLYDLHSEREEPIRGVRIEWAALVTDLKRRSQ